MALGKDIYFAVLRLQEMFLTLTWFCVLGGFYLFQTAFFSFPLRECRCVLC